jgi:hypothetical protein
MDIGGIYTLNAIFNPQVMMMDDGLYHAWFSGQSGNRAKIYHATSPDGFNFQNQQLEMTYGTSLDPDSVGAPFVRVEGDVYRMWYSGCDWSPYENQINHAIKNPGDTAWTKTGVVMDNTGPYDTPHAFDSSIIVTDEGYEMFYEGRDTSGVGRILHATSPDGYTWTRTGIVIEPTLPQEMGYIGYSDGIQDNGIYKLWYSGYDGTNMRIFYAEKAPENDAQDATCTVSFYMDSVDPENLIDSVENVLVPADGQTPVSMGWNPVAGEHDIIVVVENVNPADSNQANNIASIPVLVTSSDEVDLSVSADDIFISNDEPASGTPVSITANIQGDRSISSEWLKHGVVLDVGGWGEDLHVHGPCVLQLENGTYLMFYSGKMNDGASSSYYHRIFRAFSYDGLAWHKEGMVLNYGGAYAGNAVYHPNVWIAPDGTYHMWYAGQNPESGNRARILHATSPDGFNFIYDGMEINFGSAIEPASVNTPFVMPNDNGYRMWYLGTAWSPLRNWINHAHKTNLADAWVKDGTVLWNDGIYDNPHAQRPWVLPTDAGYEMFYSGTDVNGVGRILHANSPDGLKWIKDDVILEPSMPQEGINIRWCSVIEDEGTYKMWYTGFDNTNNRIFYAEKAPGNDAQDATCTVSFYMDSVDPANLIGSVENVFVPADGETPVSIDWNPVAGEHEIIVVVENVNPTDKDITNNAANICVSVSEPGTHPVADAGPDQTVDVGEEVQFDGTGSYFPDATMVNTVIRTVDISGDGKYLAIGWGTNVSLFTTSSNRPLWTYDTGKKVAWVVLSEDGKYLATAQNDIPENTWQSRGYVSLFDTSVSVPQWTTQTDYPVSPQRKSLDITRDGSRIVAGTYLELPRPDYRQKVGSIYMFDNDSPAPTAVYSFPKSVMGVKFSGDGNYFAAGSFWSELRFYSVTDGLIWTKTSSDPFYTVGLDFDASRISASQGSYKRTYLYNKAGSQTWYAPSIGGAVTMEMSDDGQFFATAEYSNSAFRLFSTASSSPLWSYQPPGASRATMDMSNDGQYIVGGTFLSNMTYLFSKESGIPTFTHAADGNVWDTSCSYDGEYFASVTESGTLYLYTTAGTPSLSWQWNNAQVAAGHELEYSWDFDAAHDSDGDGDSTNDVDSIGPTPVHTYDVPGVYTVTLTVTASNGLSDTDTMTVTVIAPEPAALTVEKVKLSGIDEGVTHTYYEWELQITVTNTGGSDVLDVVVYDVLPAELGLMEIVPSVGYFTYTGMGGTRAAPVGPSILPVRSTYITWTVGTMAPGQSETLYLKVCTRLNPAGKQEFTSPGTYIINEGAYAEGVDSLTCDNIASLPANAISVTITDPVESVIIIQPKTSPPRTWFFMVIMFACFLPGYRRRRGDSRL